MHFTEAGVEEFLDIFEANKTSIRNFSGCTHLQLLKDSEDPLCYTTLSYWDKQESLDFYRQSELFVSEYCERWQISPEQVNAELPVLGRLRRLAQPAPRKAGVTKAALAVLAILGLSFAIGLAGACVHFGYLLGGGR